MPNCVVKNKDKIEVYRVLGFHPPGCIGHLPEGTEYNSFDFVKLDKNGNPYVCKQQKSKWMKEQLKNAKL